LKTRLATCFVSVAAFGFLAACGGSRWTVIQQGPADKFANKPAYTLLPVDYSSLQIMGKPEAEAMASMDDANKKDWTDIKPTFADAIQSDVLEKGKAAGLTITPGTQAAPGTLVLKPICNSMSPGHFAVFGREPSNTVLTLEISTDSGQLIDKVQFTNGTPGTTIFPTSKIRIQRDGFTIGENIASYLAGRAK
jgi:hypothetical protein